MNTIDDLEEFMLKHGENIVDMMGGEIDRIELKLRVTRSYNVTGNVSGCSIGVLMSSCVRFRKNIRK